jgi:hypothetical protein
MRHLELSDGLRSILEPRGIGEVRDYALGLLVRHFEVQRKWKSQKRGKRCQDLLNLRHGFPRFVSQRCGDRGFHFHGALLFTYRCELISANSPSELTYRGDRIYQKTDNVQ